MTSPSFCQTDTKTETPQTDSIICLPKKWVTFMVQDLIKSDVDKQTIDILNNSLSSKEEYIQTQDSLVTVYKTKSLMYKATFDEYETIDSLNQKTIASLNILTKKYKRQRNAFKIFSTALIVGFLITRL